MPQHELITKSPTRWWSRQKMMQQLLEKEKTITQVLTVGRSTGHFVMMWQDIEDLDSVQGPWSSSEIHKCLKPELQLIKWHTTIAVHRPHQDSKELSTGVLESKYEGCETDKSKNYPWPMLSHSVHGPRRYPGYESLSRHGLVSAEQTGTSETALQASGSAATYSKSCREANEDT